jgi:mannose/fructose-specific phosphotransferase system component IIA
MTGVVLVTHGGAGDAMKNAAEKVVGPLERVACVNTAPLENAASVERKIDAAVAEVGQEGVVFLVDLSGSTPFNLACRSCAGRGAVVSGMNLPMLFKLATARRDNPRALADELASTGMKSIQVRDL